MLEVLWIAVLSAVLLLIALKIFPLKRVTIYEYQKGLKYTKGRHTATTAVRALSPRGRPH